MVCWLPGEQWAKRVEDLHSFWWRERYGRDRDITPVMLCASLCPHALTRGYCERWGMAVGLGL